MSSDRRIADLCASFRSVAAQSTRYSVLLLQPIGEQSSNRRSQAFEFFEFQTAVHLFRQHGFQLGPTELRSDLLNPLVNLLCIQFAPHNEIVQVPSTFRQAPLPRQVTDAYQMHLGSSPFFARQRFPPFATV